MSGEYVPSGATDATAGVRLVSRWWMIQWLCAGRHCAYATAFDETETTAAEQIALVEAHAKAQGLNSYCGICGGPISPQPRRFPPSYQTREQVVAAMSASQAEQAAARALLDQLGATFDSRIAESRN